MIYLTILIYSAVLLYCYDVKNAIVGRRANYVLAYIVLVALMAFRYRVGGDTINYIYNFDYLTPELKDLDLFSVTRRQPIPAFLFSFFKTYLNDFTYIQALFAVFVNAVVFWFLKTNTKYYFTALFFYILCFYMRLNCEIMRESLAISFFLLGYRFLVGKSYLKYYIFAILAFLCHVSAIFLFILPFIFSSVSAKWKIIAGIVFVVTIGYFVPSHIIQILDLYMDSYTNYKSSFYGKLSIIIFNILIPLFYIQKAKSCCSADIIKGTYIYVWCGVASLFFYILFRFNNYTTIFYVIVLSNLLNYTLRKYHDTLDAIIKNCGYTIIFCYIFVSAYFTDISAIVGKPARWYVRWYPYYSVFQKDTDITREQFISSQNAK